MGGGGHNHAFPQADTQYACLHVTLKDSHSARPRDGALSGSPDTVLAPPDGVGRSTTLQATCEPMGCHIFVIIIIIIVIIHIIINYKYYHNIQTSFGLGVQS